MVGNGQSTTTPLGNNLITVGVKSLTSTPISCKIQLTTTKKVGSKMSKVIVRTEKWNTKQGAVIKAVVRDENGIFLGATNQTMPIQQVVNIVGSK